ncbi:anti-anti-sigma factor [Amycolatopsis thailandensis]|uniref:Anti-anti-sigma factor n=1 Tax=Amycolatopsis thailandensis TaxID=589330 RepID=A0A229SB26_9PSEU|nr:STAS domain-containing protein [Amycolatopsis thailandensis]OXM56142.1 anti-anti-sigma factor [Amycolatopsis thailandensis]
MSLPVMSSRDSLPGFTIDLTLHPRITVLRATGELDLAAEAGFGQALAEAEATGTPVVVDMTEVGFCGSCILGHLARAAQRPTLRGQALIVATSQRMVLRPLMLLRLEDYLGLTPDVATAVRQLGLPADTLDPDTHAISDVTPPA